MVYHICYIFLYNATPFSSEDEIDIILHGTAHQRRQLKRAHDKEQRSRSKSPKRSVQEQVDASSSEDDFEKEMNAELDRTVRLLERSRGNLFSLGKNSNIIFS